MKLWILNHVALKPNESGITRHYDLSNEIVKMGHQVTIFASSFNVFRFQWRNPRKKNYQENVNGVIFEWLWSLPYFGNGPKRFLNWISYFFLAIFRGLKKRKEKPDVIVGSSVHLFACLAAYFLSKLLKARYVVEIRDLWPRTLIDFGVLSERHPLSILLGIIEKFVYKKAEKIIVTLPGAEDYIASLGIERNKIYYIPNGIHMSRIEGLANQPSLEGEINKIRENHEKVAMYVGSHGHANALETIIESAKYLDSKQVALVFIGEGAEKSSLKKLAEPYSNIYFFESIPKEEVLSTLNLADILMVSMLNTSLYKYGISLNKLNDYLLAGKPVIFAGNVLNNIIEASGAGVTVQPEDPMGFAEGIEILLHLSQEDVQQIKDKAFQYVNEHHNIEKLAEKFLNVCSSNTKKEGLLS